MTRPDLVEYVSNARLLQHKNLTEIGKDCGFSREYIRQICNRSGIPTTDPPVAKVLPLCVLCHEPYEKATQHLKTTGHHTKVRKHREWKPTNLQRQIVALYEATIPPPTVRQIAMATGTSTSYSSIQIRRAGYGTSYNAERDTHIIEDWQSGLSRDSLVSKYKLSSERIRQIVEIYIGSGKMPELGRPSGRRK